MTLLRETGTNRIAVMRHGESRANAEGLVVSKPDHRALVECGLTERGRGQARDAAAQGMVDADTVIITSDFARARETAEIVAEVVHAAPPIIDPRLRERDFGDYEGGPATIYPDVWKLDDSNFDAQHGVETPAAVAERLTSLLSDVASKHRNADVLLVAHGDVLQILQTIFSGIPPHQHRRLRHLENAEIRRMPTSSETGDLLGAG